MAVAQLVQSRKQKNMLCVPTVEVGDLVYLHPNNPNQVVTAEDNNSLTPIIGLVIAKPDATNARVLINGIIKLDTVIINGDFFVGTSGGIATSPPTENYLQRIGYSFGDGIIDFSPGPTRVKRSL